MATCSSSLLSLSIGEIKTCCAQLDCIVDFREAEQMSYRRNYTKALRVLIVLYCLATLAETASVSFANPPQGTPRKIVSDDFTKNRQEPASPTSTSKGPQG